MYCSRHHLPTVLNTLRHLSMGLKFKTMDCVYKNNCKHFQKNKEAVSDTIIFNHSQIKRTQQECLQNASSEAYCKWRYPGFCLRTWMSSNYGLFFTQNITVCSIFYTCKFNQVWSEAVSVHTLILDKKLSACAVRRLTHSYSKQLSFQQIRATNYC